MLLHYLQSKHLKLSTETNKHCIQALIEYIS